MQYSRPWGGCQLSWVQLVWDRVRVGWVGYQAGSVFGLGLLDLVSWTFSQNIEIAMDQKPTDTARDGARHIHHPPQYGLGGVGRAGTGNIRSAWPASGD
jgi:hypothetical protein